MSQLSYTLYSPDESGTPIREKIKALFSVPAELFMQHNLLVMKDDGSITAVALINPQVPTEQSVFSTSLNEISFRAKIQHFFPIASLES